MELLIGAVVQDYVGDHACKRIRSALAFSHAGAPTHPVVVDCRGVFRRLTEIELTYAVLLCKHRVSKLHDALPLAKLSTLAACISETVGVSTDDAALCHYSVEMMRRFMVGAHEWELLLDQLRAECSGADIAHALAALGAAPASTAVFHSLVDATDAMCCQSAAPAALFARGNIAAAARHSSRR